jgi:hypothetical protein
MTVNLDDFKRQEECIYKDENYSVRDNGAVQRNAREGKRLRTADNQWTFGKPNDITGYMEIGSARIHRIVASAFHGEPPTKEHVVDHIDTNKRNNRPENLRWVTRLENVLLNPITAKRIAMICGSVEAFLADPSKFRDKFPEPNLNWMCTVSIQEAQTSKERLLFWAKSDKLSSGRSLDEWIFKDNINSHIFEERSELVKSDTKNAVQKNWKTPSEFLCCPQGNTKNPIYSYAEKLKIGEIFSRNKYFHSVISDFATSKDGKLLWIMCKSSDDNAIKPWSLAKVTYEDKLFVHTNLGSFFKENGAVKEFTLAQGLEWTGGDTFDDLTG